jgi:hypothetical protein
LFRTKVYVPANDNINSLFEQKLMSLLMGC